MLIMTPTDEVIDPSAGISSDTANFTITYQAIQSGATALQQELLIAGGQVMGLYCGVIVGADWANQNAGPLECAAQVDKSSTYLTNVTLNSSDVSGPTVVSFQGVLSWWSCSALAISGQHVPDTIVGLTSGTAPEEGKSLATVNMPGLSDCVPLEYLYFGTRTPANTTAVASSSAASATQTSATLSASSGAQSASTSSALSASSAAQAATTSYALGTSSAAQSATTSHALGASSVAQSATTSYALGAISAAQSAKTSSVAGASTAAKSTSSALGYSSAAQSKGAASASPAMYTGAATATQYMPAMYTGAASGVLPPAVIALGAALAFAL